MRLHLAPTEARGTPRSVLTLDDVPQALGEQQLLEPGHLLLQLPHQSVVGVLVDHGVAADLLGAVGVSGSRRRTTNGVRPQLSVAPPELPGERSMHCRGNHSLLLNLKYMARSFFYFAFIFFYVSILFYLTLPLFSLTYLFYFITSIYLIILFHFIA